ncbi:hypothetical protein MNBD_GAMMA12-1771 [hydrothermal vent metagenome]|uniref:STAS domain-containing protein n=1 Tax=hydrothermal vent metagenome TaxID=652676 RepID=A0A3B0XVL8_9ZZZZ
MDVRSGTGGCESMSTQSLENWPQSYFYRVLRNFKAGILSAFISYANFIYSRTGKTMSKVEIQKSSSGKIEIRGELSYDNVMTLAHDASGVFACEQDLCIDLGGITHTDSSGIALLVEWLSDARHHNQEINFINVPEQVMDVARVSHLDRVLPMSEAIPLT